MQNTAEIVLAPSFLRMACLKLEFDVEAFAGAPLAKKRLRLLDSIRAVLEQISSEPLDTVVANQLYRYLICLRGKLTDVQLREAFRLALRHVERFRSVESPALPISA